MKSSASTLGSYLLGVLFIFCLLLIATDSFAQDSEVLPNDGKVEIIYPAEQSAPYRERKGNWSGLFALSLDQMLPDKYRSKISNTEYSQLFGGSPVPLLQVQIGGKFNFPLGGIGITAQLGAGQVEDARVGDLRTLSLSKKGLGAHFVMDNLFPDPYVAPYVEAQIYSFDWEEKSSVLGSQSGSTAMGTALSVGALFQLNWLDPDSALQAHDNSGLTNTFLDVFISQYNTSDSATDPNFQTGTNFGGGLRLEF